MKEIVDNKYINPRRFIKLVNEKCLNKLGHTVINNIYSSPNKKIVVEFTDGTVLNYANYRNAFDHLNVAYNLKLSVVTKKKNVEVLNIVKEDVSKVGIAKNKIEILIKNLKNLKNVKLNNINLYDYFDSNEWKKNNFNQSELSEIIDHLENSQDTVSKKYVATVKKILYRG